MTGPLDVLFAQVRETLECPNQDAPMHTRTGCTYCSATADAFAALSSIERHVQDMEKALGAIPGKPPYRVAGIPAGIVSADDCDATDEVLAFLAALPASGEKEEE